MSLSVLKMTSILVESASRCAACSVTTWLSSTYKTAKAHSERSMRHMYAA